MGREDDIKQMAYCIWEQEGCCQGHDLEYWLRAELIWEEKQKQPAGAGAPPEMAQTAAAETASKAAGKAHPAAAKKSNRRR